MKGEGATLGPRISAAVESLTPGYFALVMATGILSTGLWLQGHRTWSGVFLAATAVAWVALTVLSLGRLLWFRRAVADDFADPRRAFGFFTLVAGTDVLAARLGLDGRYGLTAVLLSVAGALWLVLGYVVPWTAVLGHSTRPVVATANGTWFIWVVASQSVAVAAAGLEPHAGAAQRELAVLAVVSWSVGIFLYAAAGVLVALRMMLYELRPEDLTPPYWVAMGACSITVLAGARIVGMADTPMATAMRGLAGGTAIVFWSFASWLIPVLVAAGWWRHVRHGVPLRYEATWWSIVFPLGMYAVAGLYLGQADHLPLVRAVGAAELWVALAVWAAVLLSMARHLGRTVVLGERREAAEPVGRPV
ncbi:MAG: tellurite resistance/C4-dicarboxylate transporter family protein [Angustibacter sp.]